MNLNTGIHDVTFEAPFAEKPAFIATGVTNGTESFSAVIAEWFRDDDGSYTGAKVMVMGVPCQVAFLP